MFTINNNINYLEFIDKLSSTLRNLANEMNEKTCKRARKITFYDILYFCCVKNISNTGNDITISTLRNTMVDINNMERIPFDVSEKAVRKWINKIKIEDFIKMTNKLTDYLYSNEEQFRLKFEEIQKEQGSGKKKNKKYLESNLKKALDKELGSKGRRVLFTDGMSIALPDDFVKKGFRKSSNKLYATGKINGLFDMTAKIPINYNLFKHADERMALLDQIKVYCKEGDIIVADRGYFSEEMVHKLKKLGIDFVLRMRRNSKYVKSLLNKDSETILMDIDYKGEKISTRIIKYTIKSCNLIKKEDSEFYICTTLPSNFYF